MLFQGLQKRRCSGYTATNQPDQLSNVPDTLTKPQSSTPSISKVTVDAPPPPSGHPPNGVISKIKLPPDRLKP